MAGSWMNGWAGWWPRRWPLLPPPPHVCVWAEEPPKDFLVLWLLQGRKESDVRQQDVAGERGGQTDFPSSCSPVRLVSALPFAFQDPLQHILGGVCGVTGQLHGATVTRAPLGDSILGA